MRSHFASSSCAIGVVFAVPAVTMATAKWLPNDIYNLSPMDTESVKRQVAAALALHYRDVNFSAPYAFPVSGIEPWSETVARDKVAKYLVVRATYGTGPEVNACSTLSTVINGCQIDWTNNGMPFNKGYIESFWASIEDGSKHWDVNIERKAGGVLATDGGLELYSAQFVLSSMSAPFALVRHVVNEVMNGRVPDPMYAVAFMSIRITWLLDATADEIFTIKAEENLEQHNRKRWSELDNLFATECWRKAMKDRKCNLDNNKAMDVFKFALCLGDPRVPGVVPNWMTSLLKGKQPSIENKLAAISDPKVTIKLLNEKKATVNHPEMRTYQQIQLRTRALKGFNHFAKLHADIAEEMGRKGFAKHVFPIGSALLLDVGICTSVALTGSDKNNVPQYRDGALGDQLQVSMCDVARRRAFEFEFVTAKGAKPLFGCAIAWVASARFMGPPHLHMETILTKFADESGAADAAQSLRRSLWQGDHDVELARICQTLPSSLDLDPANMQTRLAEVFKPIVQLKFMVSSEASKLLLNPPSEVPPGNDGKEDDDKKDDKKGCQDAGALPEPEGDVTDTVCPHANYSERKKSVEAMNKLEEKNREDSIEREVMKAAVSIYRTRVKVTTSCLETKIYFEKENAGVRARLIYGDLTQHAALQTRGEYAKQLNLAPGKTFLKELAEKIVVVPCTPITGQLIMRTGNAGLNMSFFYENIETFKFPRTIFSPIEVPAAWLRIVRSAARRSLGPSVDLKERSGVEFQLRTIGTVNCGPCDQCDTDEEEEEFKADDEEEEDNLDSIAPHELEEMSDKTLAKRFGQQALNLRGALFQHASNIAESGEFLPMKEYIQVMTESGKKIIYRKGQLHETVLVSALRSALATSAVALSKTDAFVQVCGGTPEGIVGAILCGFQHVVYVGTDKECKLMKFPSEQEEQAGNFDILNYQSPDPEEPEMGSLAHYAIKKLASYIKNYIFEKNHAIKLPPPFAVHLPPLRKYTFYAITGRVVAHTVKLQEPEEEHAHPSPFPPRQIGDATPKATAGPGSSAGSTTPGSTGKKRKSFVAKEKPEETEEPTEEEDEELDAEEPGEQGMDDLSLLDQLEAAGKPKARRPEKKRKAE